MQSTVPTYVAEISPRELRGIMLGFFNLASKSNTLLFLFIVPRLFSQYFLPFSEHWATCGNAYSLGHPESLPRYQRPAVFPSPSLRRPGPPHCLSRRSSLFVGRIAVVARDGQQKRRGQEESLFHQQGRTQLFGRGRGPTAGVYAAEGGGFARDCRATFGDSWMMIRTESYLLLQSKGASYFECLRGTDLRRTFVAVFPAITQNLSGQNLVGTYATCKSSSHINPSSCA